MKQETSTNFNLTQRVATVIGIVALILLIPFVVMQFTKEVNWDLKDFATMGLLLFIAGISIEIVTRKLIPAKLKLALILTILFVLFLVWAELAVGLFGTPFAGH